MDKMRTLTVTVRYRRPGVTGFCNFKLLLNYLIHNCVGTNDVVSVRPQAGESCWGVRFYFLFGIMGEDK